MNRAVLWMAAIALTGAVVCSAQGPTIRSLDATGRLTFAEFPGAGGYQVEYTPFIRSAWTNSGPPVGGTGSGTVSVVVAPPAAGTAFYRVAALVTNPPDMVYVPAGEFAMGDSFSEGDPNERPVRPVYVSAFFMDRCEVTSAKWNEVYGWATNRGYAFGGPGAGKAADHPVHSVSWFDCVKWCNARSQKEGLARVYYADAALTQPYMTGQDPPYVDWSAGGYRLPTEAEWEKAARGGASGGRFPWADSGFINHDRANYYSYWVDGAPLYAYDKATVEGYHPTYATNDYPLTSPVGSFAVNGYGLYDMSGNLWEWCWDRFGNYASGRQTDPRGPAAGTNRVGRGGSWYGTAWDGRSACRAYGEPLIQRDYLGFRTVRVPGF